MCGLAAFSMTPGSKVNTRALTHHLFREIEKRGGMSAGYALLNRDGEVSMFKEAITATQLSLKDMPRNARHGILHTRYATKGSPKENANNHPVVSPEANIALVHNGVIYNDGSIRRGALKGTELAEVDTAVIPALIEARGIEGLTELAGDAAIGWIDQRDAETLHVARIEGSPLVMTYLTDGSAVFASTEILLMRALDSAGLEHSEIVSFDELHYARFRDGELLSEERLAPIQHYSWGNPASWRTATSGGQKASASTSTFAVAGTASCSIAANTTSFWDDEEWTDDPESIESDTDAMVFDITTGEVKAYDEDDRDDSLVNFFFYTTSHWGEHTSYVDSDKLITELKKMSKRHEDDKKAEMIFPEVDSTLNFLESVQDIGIIDTEGDQVSFVDEPNSMDDFDAPSMVRDAVNELRKMGVAYA